MTSRLEALGLSALVLYFAYHAFAGEQGLGQWSDVQGKLEQRKADLAEITIEISHLQTDIERLTPGSVDPDFAEALAREKLGFVYPGEVVLMEPAAGNAY